MPIFYPPTAGGVYAGANDTTQTAGTVVWSNSNNVSFGMNGSTITGSANAAVSDHSHGNPTLALTNISGTTASASNGLTFSLSAGNYITTAALSNHSHGNPTLALTNLTGTTASASNGFTLSLSAGAGGQGDGGNILAAGTRSAGSNSSVLFSNANGLTFGLDAVGGSVMTASHNGITTAALSNHSHGNPTLALTNLTGTTASASNGLTLSLSAGDLGAFLTTAALSNHSHGNPTLALTNLSGTTASASNGLTFSLSAAAPGGGAAASVSFVEIADGGRLTTCAVWNNATYSRRPIFIPFQCDNALVSCNTIRFFASRTGGTVLLATFMAGIYTRANSTSMNLVSSTSFAASLTTSAQFSGIRIYDLTGLSGLSLSAGGYVLGLLASIGATVSGGLNLMGGDNMALAGYVRGGTTTAATASNSAVLPFWGVFNATSGGLPSAVAHSSISGGNGVNSPDVYAIIRAI